MSSLGLDKLFNSPKKGSRSSSRSRSNSVSLGPLE